MALVGVEPHCADIGEPTADTGGSVEAARRALFPQTRSEVVSLENVGFSAICRCFRLVLPGKLSLSGQGYRLIGLEGGMSATIELVAAGDDCPTTAANEVFAAGCMRYFSMTRSILLIGLLADGGSIGAAAARLVLRKVSSCEVSLFGVVGVNNGDGARTLGIGAVVIDV